jgi:hypothetical protein
MKPKSGNLSIYPNPTSGEFTIHSPQVIKTIEIYNVLGDKVYSRDFNCASCIVHHALPPGLYFLRTAGFSAKLIIQ